VCRYMVWMWFILCMFFKNLCCVKPSLHESECETETTTCDVRNKCLKPLCFVELFQDDCEFVALLDSGAQCNVVAKDVVDKMNYVKVIGKELPKHLIAASKSPLIVLNWVEIPVVLMNGHEVNLLFAVVPDLLNFMICGLPFLHAVKGTLNVCESLLLTSCGPVPLLKTLPKIANVESLQTKKIEKNRKNEKNEKNESEKKEKNKKNEIACGKVSLKMVDSKQDQHVETKDGDQCVDAQVEKMMENVYGLSNCDVVKLRELLVEFSDVWFETLPGACKFAFHEIELSTDGPLFQKPRRYTDDQRQEIERQVDEMLQSEVIRPSNSRYSSEILLVPKPGGKWRFCIDYRLINKYTVPDRFPLPRIDELLHAVKSSKHFVALDLRAGYWQIPMQEKSVDKTAFRTHIGLFEFLRMPFGLCNAPMTFQRAMWTLFGDMFRAGILAYLDDVLIHDVSVDGVLNKLRTVFERLRDAGMRVNLAKCTFFPRALKYLGHVIKDGCLMLDPQRVDVLKRIKPPKTQSEVRSYLGYFGHYRQYVKNFARLTKPVTAMLRDGASVNWTELHDAVHVKLVKRLSSSCLWIPCGTTSWRVVTDASKNCVAAILEALDGDKWRPVEFASKTLSGSQLNWPVREKEAFAIVFGVQKFDCFIRGHDVEVWTDHESLQWMLNAKDGKLARWTARLAEFPLTIVYKPGSQMQHVDFLSRHIETDELCVESREFPPCVLNVSENVNDVCMNDELYGEVKNNCISYVPALPTFDDVVRAQEACELPKGRGYYLTDGVWYYLGKLWIPPSLRLQVIAALHAAPPYLHPGAKRTKARIVRLFQWPGLHDDVAKYLSSCLVCQRVRVGVPQKGKVKVHPASTPFSVVYMDIWSCTFRDCQYNVLTILDSCTKWAESTVIKDHTAATVASTFLRQWVCRYGVPRVLVSDRAREFTSKLMQQLSGMLGVCQLHSSAYHPQGNAPVETFHRQLRKGLLCLEHCDSRQLEFDEFLQLTMMSYRACMHLTLGDSPAFLCHGVDLLPPKAIDPKFVVGWKDVAERIEMLNAVRLNVMARAFAKELKAEDAKIKMTKQSFELNDLVLIASPPVTRAAEMLIDDYSRKLVPKFSMPHRVVSVFSGGQRAVCSSLLSAKTQEVHISRVRFLNPPVDDVQAKTWLEAVEMFLLKTQKDKDVRRRFLDQFMSETTMPQSLKRSRDGVESGVGS